MDDLMVLGFTRGDYVLDTLRHLGFLALHFARSSVEHSNCILGSPNREGEEYNGQTRTPFGTRALHEANMGGNNGDCSIRLSAHTGNKTILSPACEITIMLKIVGMLFSVNFIFFNLREVTHFAIYCH